MSAPLIYSGKDSDMGIDMGGIINLRLIHLKLITPPKDSATSGGQIEISNSILSSFGSLAMREEGCAGQGGIATPR